MVTCPNCKAENRQEAAFCSRCGTILFAQPTPTKPEAQPIEAIRPGEPTPVMTAEQPASLELKSEAGSEPSASAPAISLPLGLQQQPVGTILAGRFRCEGTLSQEEHEIKYTVSEITQPDTLSVRVCSNPDCRTIHCPVGPDPEKYCTQCGSSLEENPLLFILQEADSDKFGYIKHVQELNLVHPNIHPPVATFQQEVSGNTLYYLVTPYSDNLPTQPEITEVLEWGGQLAGALDYLQSKGVMLGDELDLSNIGLVENKAVWRNFCSVRILPMLTDRERINNLRLLCLAMYALMTGNSTYHKDPYLPSAINDVFEKALVGEGFTNGTDLIHEIEVAKTGGVRQLMLDYQIGRRSHSGKVRSLNEDSILSIEISTVQQGIVRPSGLFVIADGMGGHAAGDMASGLVVNSIAQKVSGEMMMLQKPSFEDHESWINETVQGANLAVYEARQKAGNDMGSTLVLCLLIGTQAYLTHQGDSRIYLVNQEAIRQLTSDHSLVQHMVSTGQISADEAKFHPQRNVIYRSLGDKPFVEAGCVTQRVFPHDRLLLCSDGLTNVLEDEQIHKIILEANSAQEACDQLIEAANSAGGDDNISVILIEVISV